MGVLGDFLSNGQDRRRWIEEKGQDAADALQYYLGPGANVNALAQIADMFNPVADIGRAGTAARGVVRPGATVSERVNALGNVATDMASVLAPVAGAAYADDAARGLTEALANWSMPADDAVTRFVLDEDGAIRVWHGSPHDFDRFSMDKIGTGEGAQAYGHGLYFAERKGIAEDYRRRLASFNENAEEGVTTVMRYAGGDRAKAAELARNGLAAVTRDNLDDGGKQVAKWKEIIRLIEDPSVDVTQFKPPGRLYEVNIDANPEDFLDWDAPLSAQPPKAQAALDDFLTWFQGEDGVREIYDSGTELSGLTKYSDDLTQEQLTTAMRARGIPGIRYLDAGSRGAGDGSRNYVVFDDRLVDILGKDGQRTTPQGKAQEVLDLLTSGRASEVTDDMLDLGDPVLNARLSEYLWKNYDLPMDEASRMARAREMGFDTDTPLYHGATEDFPAFSLDRTQIAEPSFYGEGVYSTSLPNYASAYSSGTFRDAAPAPNVMPLTVRRGNEMEWPSQGNFKTREAAAAASERLRAQGVDTIRVPASAIGENPMGATRQQADNFEVVSLDPANIRSRFARFDPRLAHLRNLSAGVGGLGIALGLQPSEEEELRAYLQQ